MATDRPNDPPDNETRSLARRYAGPVILGVVLGIGLLYVLGRLAPKPAPEPKPKDESKLLALDPRLVVTVPELPADAQDADGGSASVAETARGASDARADGAATPAPPQCADGVEDADCLLATVPRAWQLVVGADPPDGGGPPVLTETVGNKLRWPVLSARAGMLVSFLVEADGAVLLLYPTPAGDLPVVEAGAPQQIPRNIDRGTLRWSAPGPRRVFVLVATAPFHAPLGEEVGRVATYYAAGEQAARFFGALRGQVHADLVSGRGEWSIAEAMYRVEPAAP